MQFLDATTDVAFKKLFGDKRNSELTISFLNNILGRKKGHLITKVVINNSENLPIIKGSKKSILDINCTDQTGNEYVVEVQREDEGDFLARSQFYTSYCLTRQLSKRGEYTRLVPVIFVGVVKEFNLFPEHDRYLTHHTIVDNESGKRTLDLAEYHFIELKKFNKSLDEGRLSVTDQWIYLLKYAHELEEIPKQLQKDEDIASAMHLLERAQLTQREFEEYLKELEDAHSLERIEATAVKRGMKEGLEKGMERGMKAGMEKGMEKGMAVGEKKKAKEFARYLLEKKIAQADVARITGLLIDEIKGLKG